MISNSLKAPLSIEIKKEHEKLMKLIASIPVSERKLINIEGTGGTISIADLIAYQIGWGKCLISWYEAGIKGNMPEMPGEGFSKWNYTAIAEHFYNKYQYDQSSQQEREFQQVVIRIIEIVEMEYEACNLEKLGIWSWCTLSSGKQWPLSKWIKVNSWAPYKRASSAIRNTFLPNK